MHNFRGIFTNAAPWLCSRLEFTLRSIARLNSGHPENPCTVVRRENPHMPFRSREPSAKEILEAILFMVLTNDHANSTQIAMFQNVDFTSLAIELQDVDEIERVPFR